MRIVTLDVESFWSQTHTLTKMSPMAYCMHPETEIISMAIKHDHHPTDVWFGEDEIQRVVSKLDWSDCLVIGHNLSGFDSMILSWRLGIKPKMWGCTLAMARPIHTIDVGNSLAKLVEHYKLGVKDNSALVNTRGRHLKDFTDAERAAMKVYNRADVDQCYELFKILRKHYSVAELMHIDATIRMLVEPQFLLDTPLLKSTLVKERDRKQAAVLELAELLDLDIQGDTSEVAEQVTARLASSAKFSEILAARGVETPMKPSPTNPLKQVPALAKTDQEFLDLQEHEDPIVSAAASARLAIKSTILETRIEAFLEAGEYCGGYLPVPLNYCGAVTTGRWSGWAYNPQNLSRINPDKPKLSDALRNSLKAGPGKKVIVADLSGIELRVNMFLWKVPYAMELFEANPAKADLYKYFAANSLYHVPEDQISKQQRQIGKISHLGLGFGAGAATFQKVAKIMGGVNMELSEATDIVGAYRQAHSEITEGWRTCHRRLQDIHDGRELSIDPWGHCVTHPEGIKLPSGRLIRYPGLHVEVDAKGKDEWWYGTGRHRARIYAGKVTENCVQALARDVIADNSLDFFRQTGLRPALMVHDELVYVVPEDRAEDYLNTLQRIMQTRPKWWPELVTWSEGDIADTYGAAK